MCARLVVLFLQIWGSLYQFRSCPVWRHLRFHVCSIPKWDLSSRWRLKIMARIFKPFNGDETPEQAGRCYLYGYSFPSSGAFTAHELHRANIYTEAGLIAVL